MGNEIEKSVIARVGAIANAEPRHMTDAEKLDRIKGLTADYYATRAAQRAEYERKLEDLEKELATT